MNYNGSGNAVPLISMRPHTEKDASYRDGVQKSSLNAALTVNQSIRNAMRYSMSLEKRASMLLLLRKHDRQEVFRTRKLLVM